MYNIFLCVLSFFWRSTTTEQILIKNFWPSAPVNIDAAYESRRSDRILLFKGTVLVLCIYLRVLF